MHIRKITKRTGKEIFHLLEPYRGPKGPRQRLVLRLDKFALPSEDWKVLATAIDCKLKGQLLLHLDSKIDMLSDHYCSLIEQKRLSDQQNIRILTDDCPRYETVDIGSLKSKNIRSIGAEHIAFSTYKELELDQLFQQLGFSRKHRDLAALSIIGRLVNPDSENATREWARHTSGLELFLQTSFTELSNNALYRIADKIYANQHRIENHLQEKERSIFNLKEKLVLYDLTNVHLEGKASNNSKAKFGVPKQKRTDCKLISLGLIIDEDGFPKRSKIMAGNQSEPNSLLEMIALLEDKTIEELAQSKRIKKGKTVVLDAGITTDSNLAMLTEYGYDYICVARTKPISAEEIDVEKLKLIKKTKRNSIEVQLFKDETENILYCRSFMKGEKERSMLDKFIQKFEAELTCAREGLKKKNGVKKYEKVLERIGRIRERNRSVNTYYHINVLKDDNSGNAKDIIWERSDFEKLQFSYSGSYYLRTSRQDIDEEELWNVYNTLNMVEAAFRSLKSELAFRPVYHQNEYRADSHLFIAVIAYHLLNTIRTRLLDKKIHISWDRLRKLMSTHVCVTTTIDTKEGKRIVIKQASEPEYFHREVYQALNLKHNPLSRLIKKL